VKLRVFTLRLEDTTGAFDDSEVVEFLGSREALAVSERFFVHERVPTLVLVVQYRDAVTVPRTRRKEEAERGPGSARRAPALDIRAEDQPLFEALRKWRNQRAKQDGRPPYVLFTNAQLAAIASSRPESQTALAAIEGVGTARVRDYAEEVLVLVQETPAKLPEEGADAAAAGGA